MANYPRLVTAYGKVAADLAREFYQKQRDEHFKGEDGVVEYVAQSAQLIPEQWGAEDVRDAFAGEHGMSVGGLPGKAMKRAMQRADETIGYNARKDKARPYWAVSSRLAAAPSARSDSRARRTAAHRRSARCLPRATGATGLVPLKTWMC